MKTLRLVLVGAVFTQVFLSSATHAQVTARRMTRRIAPYVQPPHTNATVAPAPKTAAPSPAPAPTVAPRIAAPVRIVQPPVDPEKARAAKLEAVRKTVEFQKKRAAEGSESAQYELGIRYLKGDGLEKDEALGRKWLTESAKNGYTPAVRKIEELDRADAPPKPEGGAK